MERKRTQTQTLTQTLTKTVTSMARKRRPGRVSSYRP